MIPKAIPIRAPDMRTVRNLAVGGYVIAEDEAHAQRIAVYLRRTFGKGAAARRKIDGEHRVYRCRQATAQKRSVVTIPADDFGRILQALERADIRLEGTVEFIERYCQGENATAKRNIVMSVQEECRDSLALARKYGSAE